VRAGRSRIGMLEELFEKDPHGAMKQRSVKYLKETTINILNVCCNEILSFYKIHKELFYIYVSSSEMG